MEIGRDFEWRKRGKGNGWGGKGNWRLNGRGEEKGRATTIFVDRCSTNDR